MAIGVQSGGIQGRHILKHYLKTQCENVKTMEDNFKKPPPAYLTHQGDRLQTGYLGDHLHESV